MKFGGEQMEYNLRAIYQPWASRQTTKGILLVDDLDLCRAFDLVFLVVTDSDFKKQITNTYFYEENRILLYVIPDSQLREWVLAGTNKIIIEWFLYGKVIFDRNDFLHQFIQELKDFPFYERKVKLGIEFARLICNYKDGKALYQKQQYLDAYTYLLQSLQHLGKIAVIEKGLLPKTGVWKQVKRIEPEICKMYDEIINNDEQLSKRLELIILALEFFIHKKIELCTTHLLDVLKTKDQWTLQEIVMLSEFRHYSYEIVPLIEFLVEKNYISVVLDGDNMIERRYSVKNK